MSSPFCRIVAEDLLRDELKPEPEWKPDRGATRIKILDEGGKQDGKTVIGDIRCSSVLSGLSHFIFLVSLF